MGILQVELKAAPNGRLGLWGMRGTVRPAMHQNGIALIMQLIRLWKCKRLPLSSDLYSCIDIVLPLCHLLACHADASDLLGIPMHVPCLKASQLHCVTMIKDSMSNQTLGNSLFPVDRRL